MKHQFSKARGRFYPTQTYCFFCGYGGHLFFQTKSGKLKGVGSNGFGQLSTNDKKSRFTPTEITCFKKNRRSVKDIAVGWNHSVFLTSKGDVFTSGDNDFCQLLVGEGTLKLLLATKIEVFPKEKIVGVYAGPFSTFLLTKNGEVISGGRNNGGATGHPCHTDKTIKRGTKIENLKDVISIVPGGDESSDAFIYAFTFFLKKNGSIHVCGSNGFGKLAFGSNCYNAERIEEVTYFKEKSIEINSMLANSSNVYFLTKDKKVYGAGKASGGQLGTDREKQSNVPVLCRGMCGFQRFFCGTAADFVVFQKDNAVLAWGHSSGIESYGNYYGAPQSDSPVDITYQFGGRKIEQISVAGINTYVICDGGKAIFGAGGADNGSLMKERDNNPEKFILMGEDFDLKKLDTVNLDRKERIEFMLSIISIYYCVFCIYP